jgi:isopenicillin N synthase-like dioxygenase
VSLLPLDIVSILFTDWSVVFTVLAPGDVRALEVMSRDGYWISAPPKEGCFIVNVGDQLQAWSNDLYVSTLHRVLNYSGVERYSVPFFFSANFETVIEVCFCNTWK